MLIDKIISLAPHDGEDCLPDAPITRVEPTCSPNWAKVWHSGSSFSLVNIYLLSEADLFKIRLCKANFEEKNDFDKFFEECEKDPTYWEEKRILQEEHKKRLTEN